MEEREGGTNLEMPDCKAATLSVCSVDRWTAGDGCMAEYHRRVKEGSTSSALYNSSHPGTGVQVVLGLCQTT